MRVRRRHVFYVQGYDPRGSAWYQRLFRTGYRRYCALYHLQGVVQNCNTRRRGNARTWSTVTQGRGFEVETIYQFLQWDDIIRRDFARPTWWKILRALAVLASPSSKVRFGASARRRGALLCSLSILTPFSWPTAWSLPCSDSLLPRSPATGLAGTSSRRCWDFPS